VVRFFLTPGTSDRLFTSMDNESVISLKCEQMDDRSESDEENIYHVADEFENMLGLSSHTTLDRRRRQRKVVPGLRESSFPLAIDLYEEGDLLVATHDEARSLRMLEVMTHPDVPECPILIGDSWSADYR